MKCAQLLRNIVEGLRNFVGNGWRKCWLPVFSTFPAMLFKTLLCHGCKILGLCVKGLSGLCQLALNQFSQTFLEKKCSLGKKITKIRWVRASNTVISAYTMYMHFTHRNGCLLQGNVFFSVGRFWSQTFWPGRTVEREKFILS